MWFVMMFCNKTVRVPCHGRGITMMFVLSSHESDQMVSPTVAAPLMAAGNAVVGGDAVLSGGIAAHGHTSTAGPPQDTLVAAVAGRAPGCGLGYCAAADMIVTVACVLVFRNVSAAVTPPLEAGPNRDIRGPARLLYTSDAAEEKRGYDPGVSAHY